MKRVASAIVIFLLVLTGSVWAQQSQQPQQQQKPQQGQQAQQPGPKTVEERDAFMALRNELDPAKQIELGDQFMKKYPDSTLRSFVYEMLCNAYRQQNNFDKTVEYGEKAIAENPNSLLALVIVAAAVPERVGDNELDREQKLTKSEQYAKHALQLISALSKPPTMSEQEWDIQRKTFESSPHASLGLVYLKRKMFKQAAAELKQATELNVAQPSSVDYFRLGVAYELDKNYDGAVPAFQRAIELGGVTKERAQAELDRVQKLRGQATVAPPAEKKEGEKKEPEKKEPEKKAPEKN